MVGALEEAVCFKLGIDYEAEIVSIMGLLDGTYTCEDCGSAQYIKLNLGHWRARISIWHYADKIFKAS